MPINELERHPFLNYLEEDHQEVLPDYQGLIIGSFPVYSCTGTVGLNLEVTEQRFVRRKAYMKFFYCSKKSLFWKYCSEALGVNNPVETIQGDPVKGKHILARQRSIALLQQHKLLMTDSVYQTNRGGKNGEGSADSELWITRGANRFIVENLQLNHSIPALLAQNPSIKNLYFTATGTEEKSPFGWFKSIFGTQIQIGNQHRVGNRLWSAMCTIHGRTYTAFFLPTPKTRGFHFTDNSQTLMFVNYMRSRYPVFYQQIDHIPKADRTPRQEKTISEIRNEALITCYRQALVEHNLHFDGTMAM